MRQQYEKISRVSSLSFPSVDDLLMQAWKRVIARNEAGLGSLQDSGSQFSGDKGETGDSGLRPGGGFLTKAEANSAAIDEDILTLRPLTPNNGSDDSFRDPKSEHIHLSSTNRRELIDLIDKTFS